ncbi:hypothetical protein J2T05_004052 [Cupriavidus necator]|nr:hypothetical protein [Cupriavidus necator]
MGDSMARGKHYLCRCVKSFIAGRKQYVMT